ncbi:MAG: hypothetical protein H7Y03_02595 [Chitinophagaceae bacterium]|nr:hypothetical protein [Chitinophagaceae bacterium]
MTYLQLTNEPELLSRLARGDKRAHDAFLQHYKPLAKRFVSGCVFCPPDERDMEDLIQDVFLKVWEVRDTMENVQSFTAYLLCVARNVLINSERHRQKRKKVFIHLSFSRAPEFREVEDKMAYKFYHQSAHRAITGWNVGMASRWCMKVPCHS